VRSALGTLPWVEQDSIQTIVKTREVRFNLKDKTKFNEEELRDALTKKGFDKMTVKAAPK
jgi:hypothetical protein